MCGCWNCGWYVRVSCGSCEFDRRCRLVRLVCVWLSACRCLYWFGFQLSVLPRSFVSLARKRSRLLPERVPISLIFHGRRCFFTRSGGEGGRARGSQSGRARVVVVYCRAPRGSRGARRRRCRFPRHGQRGVIVYGCRV